VLRLTSPRPAPRSTRPRPRRRAEERAAAAIQFKDEKAGRHAQELRRLETAYEDRADALTAASATHQARAEAAEAEAARLREELASR